MVSSALSSSMWFPLVGGPYRSFQGRSSRLSSSLQQLELALHRAEDGTPVTGAGLAEQARRRIPGRAAVAQLPAPVGGRRQQHPCPEPHGGGEMGNRSVDRDQEIELRESGRSFGEIEDAAADIV